MSSNNVETCALYGLWGKLNEDTGAVQPLAAHLADVAAVMEGILKSPLSQRRMERLLGEVPQESLTARLCVLAAWHDFGKISPMFQLKRREKMERLTPKRSRNHIDTAINAMTDAAFANKFVKMVSPISAWFGENESEEAYDVLSQYFSIILSHHGSSLTDNRILRGNQGSCWNASADYDPWRALEELMKLSRRWFPEAFGPEGQLLPPNAQLQHLYAGTLMLADWIASDNRLFPFCGEKGRPSVNEEDPIVYARANVPAVLKDIGWDPSDRRPSKTPGFCAQFGFSANAVQKAVDGLSLSPEGGLYILEAETGSGKTEAALRLYTRLFSAGLVDGLYFANPLRFAATQLFERMVAFSRNSFGEGALPVTLAVPGYLRVDDQMGLRLPKYQVDWGELNRRGMGWSAESPKRFLAAPLASGTVDQALMATLLVPHAHMRAAALQRSLLVIDEVHSSDAYMSKLIYDLILWFSLLGGHVLLMSATLGGSDRQAYLDAWRRSKQAGLMGFKRPSLSFDEAWRCAYPLLSTPDGEVALPNQSQLQKTVAMRLGPLLTDAEAVAELAAELFNSSPDGEPCVLILRNTVRQARLTLEALKKRLPADSIFSVNGILAAHHSRYAREDRRLLDREVERRFGKAGNPLDQKRRGCVLVATQTLEQSLDVDFDLLITDLCPADVLLQRIGRLHRHARTARPEAFAGPQCGVLAPHGEYDWLLAKEARRFGYGEDRAYENLLSLAATWRLIQDNPQWTLPRQNRWLVESAAHPGALEALGRQLGNKRWEENARRIEGSDMAKKQMADLSSMKWQEGFCSNVISRDAGHMVTRLGMMDRTVKIEPAAASPFGGDDLKSLSLPGWLFPQEKNMDGGELKANEDESVVTLEGCGDYQSFMLEGQLFYYGSSGLLSEREFEELEAMK